MNCRKCGNGILPDAKFCEKCGEVIEKEQVAKFCSKCGTPNNDAEAFCGNCGHPLKAQARPNVIHQQGGTSVRSQEPQTDKQNQYTTSQQASYTAIQSAGQEETSSRGWLSGLIIAVLIVGLLAISWALFGREWLKGRDGEGVISPSESMDVTTNETLADDEVAVPTEVAIIKQQVTITISHVDVSQFPKIKCYVNIVDQNGMTLKEAKAENFEIWETLADGTRKKVTLDKVLEAGDSAGMSINLVMDRSGSMGDYDLMQAAQMAANSLVTEIKKNDKDFVSITAFEDHVSVLDDFTQNYETLHYTINALSPGGGTALYDALYSALLRTNERGGAKCIIAFTDGLDNRSNYTYGEVVELSRQTSIPIYIIGLGQDFSAVDLQQLAVDTAGFYYGIQGGDIGALLAQIYRDIYQNQLEQYVFTCQSTSKGHEEAFRTIEIDCTTTSEFVGSATREYVPKPEIIDKYTDDESVHRYDIIVADATWSEAKEDCLRRGGYLVRINSDEEYKAILKQIESEGKEKIQFLMGAARNPNYDEYYWMFDDGLLGTEKLNGNPKYDKYWLDGEPSYYDVATGIQETCMTMFRMKDTGQWVWNDIPDNLLGAAGQYKGKMGYICEYED